MDKLRSDFEEWYARKHPLKRPSVRKLKLWEAYRDSRASIVVDLPEQKEDKARNCSSDDIAYGFNQGVGACRYSLRSIGLSIKGE